MKWGKLRVWTSSTVFATLAGMLGIIIGLALTATVSPNLTNQAYYQTTGPVTGTTFSYWFNSVGTLYEAGAMMDSTSPYWWLNSGGELHINGSVGSTMVGDASPLLDRWSSLYLHASPTDTDNGTHPQNLFRLVTKSLWESSQQEVQFRILADNLSSSFNRNASNGLLLMSRYGDAGQTLYYAGIRVDGTAVIKKKFQGTYYTMAQKKVFPGMYSGWQDDTNLIPHNEWITLRDETITNDDGSVTVQLFMREAGDTTWQKLLEATDSGQFAGTHPINGAGNAGIRTDFMDVQFENYRIQAI